MIIKENEIPEKEYFEIESSQILNIINNENENEEIYQGISKNNDIDIINDFIINDNIEKPSTIIISELETVLKNKQKYKQIIYGNNIDIELSEKKIEKSKIDIPRLPPPPKINENEDILS